MEEFRYANPEFFYLFAIIPVLVIIYILKQKKYYASLKVSSIEAFEGLKPTFRQWMRHSLLVLRIAALALLIVAMARPQTITNTKTIKSEGIDIVLAQDVSGSMQARDLKPDRLRAAKKTAAGFIDKRKGDRVGLVVFSSESMTLCPITIDHKIIQKLLKKVDKDIIDGSKTAIGEGLSTAISRLKDSKAKSKVIILLTDGENNHGAVSPFTAAEMAKSFGIKVYTIGVGSRGYAPYPVDTPWGKQIRQVKVDLDEKTLKEIAKTTNGKYYRATRNSELEKIYDEIDKLEKSEIDEQKFKTYYEEYLPLAIAAGLLLLLELFLRYFIFRTIP